MNNRCINCTGSFGVKIGADTAKFTNMIITRLREIFGQRKWDDYQKWNQDSKLNQWYRVSSCAGALSDAFFLRLSHTSGLSQEQRGLGRPKLAQVAHVAHASTPFSGSKGQGQKAPGSKLATKVNVWGRCSGDPENVLGVGNYCYVASARRRGRRWGAHGEERGGGISCRHAHSLLNMQCFSTEN